MTKEQLSFEQLVNELKSPTHGLGVTVQDVLDRYQARTALVDMLAMERNVLYARLTAFKMEIRGHFEWLQGELKWWVKVSEGRIMLKILADEDALTEQDRYCMCDQGIDGTIQCPVHSLIAIRDPDAMWIKYWGDD
jgi:hypothetical protein